MAITKMLVVAGIGPALVLASSAFRMQPCSATTDAVVRTCEATAATQAALPRDVSSDDRLAFDGDRRALALLARDVKNEAAPSAWIGVRLTPISKALAAHFGDDGMMIGNVAADSPAAASDVGQFDILREVNGTAVSSMDEVLQALMPVRVGDDVRLTFVSGGKTVVRTLKAESRPDNPAAISYLYDEPTPDVTTMNVRGRKLELGPDGRWRIEELGPMQQPFGMLPGLEQFDLKNWDQWSLPHMMAPFSPGDFEDFSDLNRWQMFLPRGGQAPAMHLEFNDDEGRFSVQRDENGAYVVETTDADGNEERYAFENEDVFADEAPALYDRFRALHREKPALPGFGGAFDVNRIPGLPGDMRQRVQEMLDRARDIEKRVEMRTMVPGGAQRTESVSITNVNGQITIKTMQDGRSEVYEFDSIDEMKQNAPELYERYRGMLE